MRNKTKGMLKLSIPTPFAVGTVNVYLLKDDSLVLIDTGPNTKEALEALKSELKQSGGYALEDIEIVVLSHHHSDHAGLLEQFDHAQIFGHWRNEPWITFDENFYQNNRTFIEQFFRQEGVDGPLLESILKGAGPDKYLTKGRLDGILQEGDKMPGCSEWTVLETPGHAQSHLSFLNERDGSLIAGDTIISHLFPTPLLEPPYNQKEKRPQPLLQLHQTLKKYLDFPIGMIYSGHGSDLFQAKKWIEKQFQKHEERAQKIRRFLLEKGRMTSFEISKQLFPNAYHRATYLTMSETIGILDLMASRGEIIAAKRNEHQIEYELA